MRRQTAMSRADASAAFFFAQSRSTRPRYPFRAVPVIYLLKLLRQVYPMNSFHQEYVFYPHNYGFIPQTLCDDGDPLDVLVICDGPLIPGCFVQVRPICYMVMEDEKGNDEKLLAVVEKDPHYSHIKTIDDIPDHTLKEISQFFETYKTLEKEKWVKIGGWKDKNEAFKLIKSTHEKYKREKNLSSDSLISLSDNK